MTHFRRAHSLCGSRSLRQRASSTKRRWHQRIRCDVSGGATRDGSSQTTIKANYPSDGKWHAVITVFDQGTMLLYIDGVLKKSSPRLPESVVMGTRWVSVKSMAVPLEALSPSSRTSWTNFVLPEGHAPKRRFRT